MYGSDAMTPTEREGFERELRARFDAGDLSGATAAIVRGYGPELYRFLVAMVRDADAADDVFAGTCERIWRGLPQFRWDGACRAWCYAIARHEFLHWTERRDRQRRQIELSDAPLSRLVVEIRSTTAAHLRTDVKDGFAELRATLAPEDQLLLQLRVDADLPWRDLARALADDDREPTTNQVAALRKRYERLKRELQALARARGLVP